MRRNQVDSEGTRTNLLAITLFKSVRGEPLSRGEGFGDDVFVGGVDARRMIALSMSSMGCELM